MKSHNYDTDSFKDDLNTVNTEQSNLYSVCNKNMKLMATSKQFITNIDCMFYILFNKI